MDSQFAPGEQLWYYANNDQTHGPERESDLCQQFVSGKLSMATLVWANGMAEWLPADEVDVFSSAIPEVEAEEVDQGEPELDTGFGDQSSHQTSRDTLWPSRPEPFRRYIARQIDMALAILIYFQITGRVMEDSMTSLSAHILWVIPPWAIVEGLCLHFFGSTPGKWILRIEVTDRWGRRLGLKHSLRRSIDVAVRGLGLGIPILNAFTQIHAMMRLSARGITVWDEDRSVVVRHPPLEAWRWIAVLLLVLAMAGLLPTPS